MAKAKKEPKPKPSPVPPLKRNGPPQRVNDAQSVMLDTPREDVEVFVALVSLHHEHLRTEMFRGPDLRCDAVLDAARAIAAYVRDLPQKKARLVYVKIRAPFFETEMRFRHKGPCPITGAMLMFMCTVDSLADKKEWPAGHIHWVGLIQDQYVYEPAPAGAVWDE